MPASQKATLSSSTSSWTPSPAKSGSHPTWTSAFDDEAKAAFERMSYSHRKDYVDWIEEAKRPETRERRAAKAVEQIRKGEPQR